ncbi:MAG TPA: FAD-dependent oxidoreductase [Longimicrobiales bacterium]|nr:FAD-dependent oxidoreductase [Longimicrobiales bacterium]
MSASPSIAVVGGGPAGLAAAWRLVERGARVVLYEREATPGGRLRTEALEGARVDVGVQYLASHYEAALALVRAAGAESLLVRSPGRDALWRRGRAHALTYGSVPSMAASSALPAGLKLRLAARYLPFLARHGKDLDLCRPAAAAAAGLDGESIAAWGERELGRDFVDLLVHPLMASYYGSASEETSAGFYHALSAAGLAVSIYAVRGGMSALAAALTRALVARGVELRAGVEAHEVASSPDGVRVWHAHGEEAYAGAVVALPPRAAERVATLPPAVRAWLAEVRTRPALTVALALERPLGERWFALAFAGGSPESAHLAAVAQLERKAAGLVPEGRGVLLLFPAPRIMEELAALEPAEVLERLLQPLEGVLPDLRARTTRARVYPLPEGYTLFGPGHLAHIQAMEALELPRALELAGDYRVAPTVDGAVRSGGEAAERLLARLGDGAGGAP